MLRLKPEMSQAHYPLATALMAQAKLPEALAHFREALRIEPEEREIRSTMLFCLCHDPKTTPAELFAEHCRWGKLHGSISLSIPPHGNDPDPERPLPLATFHPICAAMRSPAFSSRSSGTTIPSAWRQPVMPTWRVPMR